MTIVKKIMRRMFGDSDILSEQKFSDKTMLAKLDTDLRVKVSFFNQACADKYWGKSLWTKTSLHGIMKSGSDFM